MAVEIPVVRLAQGVASEASDVVTEEVPLTVYLNREEVATLLCSPGHWEELAVGFLASQGLLREPDELVRVEVEERRGLAWVESRVSRPLAQRGMFKRFLTSGCGSGIAYYAADDAAQLKPLAGERRVDASAVLDLMHRFQRLSESFRATGGVHSAALASAEEILVFREDIGRHNAVDKISGHCLLTRLETGDKLLLTTGRLSSEIVTKAARLGVPLLVSRAAATNLAVTYAAALGVTLIGFARGQRLTVYSHTARISM